MDPYKFWVLLTSTGFVYLLACFFLVLRFFGIQDLAFFVSSRDFLPYIATAAIVISYFLGYVAHIILNHVTVPWILKICGKSGAHDTQVRKKELYFLQNASPALLLTVQNTREIFVTFRLLIVAVILLAATLTCWLTTTIFEAIIPKILALFAVSLLLAIIPYWDLRLNQKAILDDAYHMLKDEQTSK